MKKITLNELMMKIEALEIDDEETRNKIVCNLIGHSKIISTWFGYIYCGRCDSQIGDALGGYYDASDRVIIRHKCEQCFNNFENLTWKDILFVENPFPNDEDEDEFEDTEGEEMENGDSDDNGDAD